MTTLAGLVRRLVRRAQTRPGREFSPVQYASFYVWINRGKRPIPQGYLDLVRNRRRSCVRHLVSEKP